MTRAYLLFARLRVSWRILPSRPRAARSAIVTGECGAHAAPHGSVSVWKRCSTFSSIASPIARIASEGSANAAAQPSAPGPEPSRTCTRTRTATIEHLRGLHAAHAAHARGRAPAGEYGRRRVVLHRTATLVGRHLLGVGD